MHSPILKRISNLNSHDIIQVDDDEKKIFCSIIDYNLLLSKELQKKNLDPFWYLIEGVSPFFSTPNEKSCKYEHIFFSTSIQDLFFVLEISLKKVLGANPLNPYWNSRIQFRINKIFSLLLH